MEYSPSYGYMPLKGLPSEKVILNKPLFIECGPLTALYETCGFDDAKTMEDAVRIKHFFSKENDISSNS